MATVETFNSTTTWTCPASVTTVQVECIGGGGKGGAGVGGGVGGGGGAGGYYARANSLPVTPGHVYVITVGNSPTAGFSTTQFLADVGSCAADVTSGTGDVVFAGGGGGVGQGVAPWSGGGGGGSAGSTGVGGNGQSGNAGGGGGTGGTGSPSGGGGGGSDSVGSSPGGGGGGGSDTGLGAAGGLGTMVLTYTAGNVSVPVLDTLGFGINDILNKIVINFIPTTDILGFSIADTSNLTINISRSDTVGFGIVEGAVSISHNLAGYRSMMAFWLGGADMVIRASQGNRVAAITRIYNRIADIIE